MIDHDDHYVTIVIVACTSRRSVQADKRIRGQELDGGLDRGTLEPSCVYVHTYVCTRSLEMDTNKETMCVVMWWAGGIARGESVQTFMYV